MGFKGRKRGQAGAWLTCALLLWGPASLAAQAESVTPSEGSYGLWFSLPDGGGAGLGVRKMLSSTTNFGIGVVFGFRWEDVDIPAGPQDARTSVSVGLRPDVRLYRSTSGRVIPFLALGGRFAYQKQSGAFDAWAVDFGTDVGIGAEWFPVDDMSVSGATGVEVLYRHATNGGGGTNRSFALSVFRSELSINLYF